MSVANGKVDELLTLEESGVEQPQNEERIAESRCCATTVGTIESPLPCTKFDCERIIQLVKNADLEFVETTTLLCTHDTDTNPTALVSTGPLPSNMLIETAP